MMNYCVIVPVKNEEAYIGPLLEMLLAAQPAASEIIIMDGRSTDQTAAIVNQYAGKDSRVKLIDNPQGYVPFALNKAIRSSSGDPVIRLDAHTVYAPDYFQSILETFERTQADIVGGPMRALGKTAFQKAVATCTSTSFGVGDSSFHDETAEGEAESVYLGAWRRSVFATAGYFDEAMLRNQDDEFHYRARSKGLSIYLNPAIRSWYYPRDKWSALFRQYFQYGLFKPLVLKKVSSGMRIRHLIPAGFVLYLLSLIPAYYLLGYISILPLVLYLLLDIRFSLRSQGDWKVKCFSLFIYPSLHLAYGSGFIAGLIGLRDRILPAQKASGN